MIQQIIKSSLTCHNRCIVGSVKQYSSFKVKKYFSEPLMRGQEVYSLGAITDVKAFPDPDLYNTFIHIHILNSKVDLMNNKSSPSLIN